MAFFPRREEKTPRIYGFCFAEPDEISGTFTIV